MKDLTGCRFGRLMVICVDASRKRCRKSWLCRCDCGTTRVVFGSNLTNGKTRSCGCLETESRYGRRTTHGMRNSPEYNSWADMKKRCFNSAHAHFHNYGGRGVTVCKKWLDFEGFYADMGAKPSLLHSLDRYPDINGNYEPGNCRWATQSQQNRNKRTSISITHNGKSLSLVEWSVLSGVKYTTLYRRVRAGWDFAKAITSPQ